MVIWLARAAGFGTSWKALAEQGLITPRRGGGHRDERARPPGPAHPSSLLARDYPILLGMFLLISLAVILANLITDLAYARLDPRIRYQ